MTVVETTSPTSSGLSAGANQVANFNTGGRKSPPPVNNTPPANPDAVISLDDMEAPATTANTNTSNETQQQPQSGNNQLSGQGDQQTGQTTPQITQSEGDDSVANFNLPTETPAVSPPASQGGNQIPEGARNYAEYPAESVPILKALRNPDFARHAPAIKKIYETAAKVPELERKLAEKSTGPQFFYEHPEAYRFDPEYQRVETDHFYAQVERQAWQEALLRIEQGEAWKCPTGYDEKGRLIFQDIPALANGVVDAQSKVAVTNNLMQINAALSRHEQNLSQFKGGYSQRVQQAQSQLKDIDQKLFPKLQAETDYTPADKKYIELVDKTLPQQFASHPLTGFIRKLAVASGRFMASLVKAQAEVERLKAIVENRSVATPAAVVNGGGAPSGNVDENKEVKFNGAFPD